MRHVRPVIHVFVVYGVLLSCGKSGDFWTSKEKPKDPAGDADGSTNANACSKEARVVCVESSPGVYETKGVGRSGPQCEFDKFKKEVDFKLCRDGDSGGGCPANAKVACVKKGEDYIVFTQTAQGPGCSFLPLPGEVDYKLCVDRVPPTLNQSCTTKDEECSLIHKTQSWTVCPAVDGSALGSANWVAVNAQWYGDRINALSTTCSDNGECQTVMAECTVPPINMGTYRAVCQNKTCVKVN